MSQSFDLGCLRKHVEWGYALEMKRAREVGQISRQGRRITGDIEQGGNRMSSKYLPHFLAQAGRGRIDNYTRQAWVALLKLFGEVGRDVACDISLRLARVRLRRGEGVNIPVDPDDAL